MNLNNEEIKLLYNSLLYWQRYKTLYNEPEYKLCHKLMNDLKAQLDSSEHFT